MPGTGQGTDLEHNAIVRGKVAPLAAPQVSMSAQAALAATIGAGAQHYQRERMLDRLIGTHGGGASRTAAETRQMILQRLASALRAERARAGHWTYDLNRHIGLVQAYAAETASNPAANALANERRGSCAAT